MTSVHEQSWDLLRLELEPEVRDWLDSLNDSDFKRVDEVCGMLAEKGVPRSAGPGPITWEARYGNFASGFAR